MRNQSTNIEKLYQFVLKQVDDKEETPEGKTWQGSLPPNAVYSSIQEPPEGTETWLTESQKVPFWLRPPQVHTDSSVHVENIKTLIENTNSTPVFEALKKAGGTPYFVGGAVRDALLNKSDIKDIDIEVHGIPEDSLAKLVKDLGGTKEAQVGKQFGVFKVRNIDISLPRTETKTGDKHTDFDVDTKISMSPKEASKRRDFTINSLMYDFNTGKLEDSFNGIEDLNHGVIRHIDDKTFVEDPLRVYRAAQFAARHNFTIHPDTIELAKTMDLSSLPPERVGEEFFKLLLKSNKPSIGLHALEDMDVLKKELPEIQSLKGTHQRDDYHAEGDVFKHTKMVMDEASKIIKRFPDEDDKKIIMLAALCHDLGKPDTTDEEGHAYGHEEKIEPTERVLDKILGDGFKEIREKVVQLVKLHLRPPQLYKQEVEKKENQDKAVRSLLGKHSYDFLKLLSAVSEADTLGRIHTEDDGTTKKPTEPIENKWFMERVDKIRGELGTSSSKRKGLPIPIGGERIKELTGLPTGKKVGDLIRHLQAKVENEGTLTEEQTEKYILDNPQLYKLLKEEEDMGTPIDKLWQFVNKQEKGEPYKHSPKEQQAMEDDFNAYIDDMDDRDIDYNSNFTPIDPDDFAYSEGEEEEENDLEKLMKMWLFKQPPPGMKPEVYEQVMGQKVGKPPAIPTPVKVDDPNAFPTDASGQPDKVGYAYLSELGGKIPGPWEDFVQASGGIKETKGGHAWVARPTGEALENIKSGGTGVDKKSGLPLTHPDVKTKPTKEKPTKPRPTAKPTKTITGKTDEQKADWHAEQLRTHNREDVQARYGQTTDTYKLLKAEEFETEQGKGKFVKASFINELNENLNLTKATNDWDVDEKITGTKVYNLHWSDNPDSKVQVRYQTSPSGKVNFIGSAKHVAEVKKERWDKLKKLTPKLNKFVRDTGKSKDPVSEKDIPSFLCGVTSMRVGSGKVKVGGAGEGITKATAWKGEYKGHDTGVGVMSLKLKNLTLNKDGTMSLQFRGKGHMTHMINIGKGTAPERKLNETLTNWLKKHHGITKPEQLEKLKGKEIDDKTGHYNWERNHAKNSRAETYLFLGKGGFSSSTYKDGKEEKFQAYQDNNTFFSKKHSGATMHNFRNIKATELAKKVIDKYLKAVKQDPKNKMSLKDLQAQIGLEAGKVLGHYKKAKDKDGKISFETHGDEALKSYIDDRLWKNEGLLANVHAELKKSYSSMSKAVAELKSWITNPRGSEDSYHNKKQKQYLYPANKINKDGGGFGDGGGTVFTSEDAGVFTPTHSERGKRKKNDAKKRTGIDRLADFVDEGSPERKMSKATSSFTLDLVNWVTEELRKNQQNQLSGQNAVPQKGNFRQQNSGETINEQPPRIDWKKKDKDIPEDKDDVLEFDDAETDKQAAIAQDMETDRIKQLDDEDESEKPKDTGRSSMAAPAGVNVQLGKQKNLFESGGYDSDELATGGDKDLKQGKIDDPEDENKDDEFVKNYLKSLQK